MVRIDDNHRKKEETHVLSDFLPPEHSVVESGSGAVVEDLNGSLPFTTLTLTSSNLSSEKIPAKKAVAGKGRREL